MKRFTTYFLIVFLFIAMGCLKQPKHNSDIQSNIEQVFNKSRDEKLNISSPDSALMIAKLTSQYGLENKNFELAFKAMIMSANIYNQKRMGDSVKILMNKLISIAELQKDSVYLASAYQKLAYSYKQQNQPDSSLFFQKMGFKYAKSKNNPTLPALYVEKAEYMHKYNKPDSAYIYYRLALEWYNERGHYLNIAVVYNLLSTMFIEQRLFEESKKYLQLAIHLNDSLHNLTDLSDNYNNLGIILKNRQQYDSAAFYLNKAISLSQETGNKYKEIIQVYNLGNVYSSQGDYYNAKSNFTKVYEYCQKEQITAGVVKALSGMAENEDINRQNREAATEMLEEALHLVRQVNDTQTEVGILFQIVQKQIPRSVDSLDYLMQYKDLTDSVFNVDFRAKIAENEIKYKTELKNKSIELLENKNKQHKTLAGVFSGGFVLALMLVLYIRKANKMLAVQKEEITAQAEQLKETNEKLIQLDQFKQGMTSMLVHDLKNPLNSILNISEKEIDKALIRSKQAAGQMLNLVLNILDVNKSENSKMVIKKTVFFIYDLIKKSIAQVLFMAEQKNIQIENLVNSSIEIEGDLGVIERIFINLLSNAIKYTPVNGKIQVCSRVDKKNMKVILSVKDEGPGISTEFQEKVFEKFMQIEGSKSGNIHSTGLGLTFCKIAVEEHEGKIWIDKKYTYGTSISFSLPLNNLPAPNIENPKEIIKKVELSAWEIGILKEYLPQFEKFELYEITEYRRILNEIENLVNKEWLQAFKYAVDYGNENLFDLLTEKIK